MISSLRNSSVLLALAAAACSPGTDGQPDGRPDVLFVVTDTLRADRLSFLGYERETAPFLSSLAAEGVVFERAWSSSTWTAPAVASILTGTLPVQHGVLTGYAVYGADGRATTPIELNRIPPELETLPELMTSLGYRTYGIADNANVRDTNGFTDGIGRFEGFDYRTASAVNAKLAEWAPSIVGEDGPWFVYLHYMDPHGPYHKRAPYYDFDESVLEIDHDLAPEGSQDVVTDPWVRRYEIVQLLARATTAETPEEASAWIERSQGYLDAAYDSEIRYFDAHLAEAWELLEADDDTLFVFLSDHGEELGDHGSVGHGFQVYDELLHVPLVFRLPGDAPVGRVATSVSTVDVFPTLRELLGAPPSAQSAGRSLVPWLDASAEPDPSRAVFGMRTREIDGREPERKAAVLVAGDKLIVNEPEGELELYDLETDPDETANRAEADADRAAELRALLDDLEHSLPRWERIFVPVVLSEEQRERIEELGYGGD